METIEDLKRKRSFRISCAALLSMAAFFSALQVWPRNPYSNVFLVMMVVAFLATCVFAYAVWETHREIAARFSFFGGDSWPDGNGPDRFEPQPPRPPRPSLSARRPRCGARTRARV